MLESESISGKTCPEEMESIEILQEIPPLVLKNLGDRSYEKRKAAASEIECLVHQMHVKPDRKS